MRYFCFQLACLLILLPYPQLHASDPLKTADSLISLRKYSSAFGLLRGVSTGNDNRAIVLKQVDIALNYFVLSINHAVFSFKDLQPGEDLLEMRGQPGTYDSFLFPIDSVLIQLISRYPDDGRVYRYLGDYYYDVSQRYSGRWLISDDSLFSLVRSDYCTARNLKASNYASLHRLGVIYLQQNDFDDAEPCLREAIALDPQQADPHYNLAYLLMQKRDYSQAIESGLKSLELYQDVALRSDAGRLVASCYSRLKDYESALKYLRRVVAFDPRNFYVHRMVLCAFLAEGKSDSAFFAAKRLFALHPTYPSVPQAIIEDYSEAHKASDLVSVFRRLIPEYDKNDTASGNLYFHLASCSLADLDSLSAIQSLDSAEARFRHCFPTGDQVFEAIKSQKEAIERKR
jgi:tetratricopeptide (TPR) repeat protein